MVTVTTIFTRYSYIVIDIGIQWRYLLRTMLLVLTNWWCWPQYWRWWPIDDGIRWWCYWWCCAHTLLHALLIGGVSDDIILHLHSMMTRRPRWCCTLQWCCVLFYHAFIVMMMLPDTHDIWYCDGVFVFTVLMMIYWWWWWYLTWYYLSMMYDDCTVFTPVMTLVFTLHDHSSVHTLLMMTWCRCYIVYDIGCYGDDGILIFYIDDDRYSVLIIVTLLVMTDGDWW